MNNLKDISQMVEIAIRNDLECNGPIAQQMSNIFGIRRTGSGGGVDVTTLMDKEKKITSIEDSKMNQKNSAQTVYDAIKDKVKFDNKWKLLDLNPEELRNVIRAGLESGDIAIQGDIFGVEEQISKEIMLSNRFKNRTI